jgi:hypothetical protein
MTERQAVAIAYRDQRRRTHPLCGSNLATLVRVLVENGGVGRQGFAPAAIAVGAALGRWPFTTIERVAVSARLRRAGPMPAPIFILGHWRSGTTHLYNVLAKGDFGVVTPLAAGMPWDLLGLVRLARPLLERSLPEHRYIDRIPVNPDSPQEDEVAIANMSPLSFYHGIYFPRRFERNFDRGVFLDGCSETEIRGWGRVFTHLMGKLWLDQDRRQPLIKNPVYTARIARLRRLYPQARFIHVHRNPFEVFVSMRNFFAKLFEQFALQPYEHVDVDAVILRTYTRMMERYLAESAELPPGTLVELGYTELVRDPLDTLRRIYDTLRLPGFATARPRFEDYLASVHAYRKNRYDYPEDVMAKVQAHWAPFIDHWGYGRPQPTAAAVEAASAG